MNLVVGEKIEARSHATFLNIVFKTSFKYYNNFYIAYLLID